jgi:hypothetical protein
MNEKPQKRLVIHSNAHQDKTPPAPTRPKRLVNKRQYLTTLGEKGVTYAAGVFVGLLGIPLLLLSLYLFYGISYGGIYFGGIAVVALAWSIGAFCGCKSFFKTAQEIESVAPITRHNTGDLPAVETLVRASDLSTAGRTPSRRSLRHGDTAGRTAESDDRPERMTCQEYLNGDTVF